MKSLIFTGMVLFAVAYLAYSQSNDVKHWADQLTDGQSADIALMADDLVQGVEDRFAQTSRDWRVRDHRIQALETELELLRADYQRLIAIVEQGKVTVPARYVPTDDLGVQTIDENITRKERSQALLSLIEKMQLKAAGI